MSIPSESVIKNLYFLFDEATDGLTDEQILEELKLNPNPEFDQQINSLKLMRARALARSKRNLLDKAIEKLKLFAPGTSLFQNLSPSKKQEVSILYRKYKQLTPKDQEQINLDERLLDLLLELESDDN